MPLRLLACLLALLTGVIMWRLPSIAALIGLVFLVLLSSRDPWWLRRDSLSATDTLVMLLLISPLIAIATAAPHAVLVMAYVVASISMVSKFRRAY